MYSKTQQQHLEKFADLSDQLFELGVITSDSFTGEIGEYVACNHYKLDKTSRSTLAVDGICSAGKNYQVKSKIVTTKSATVDCINLKPNLFDYLVIVYFDTRYSPLQIVKIPAGLISGEKIGITRAVLARADVLVETVIHIAPQVKTLLRDFADAIDNLKIGGVIRSRHIVGDIGEYYACKTLDLEICSKLNERGFDAIGKDGIKFEVKTRRVYESGRRNSDSRRLNKLKGKSAEYLIVVALDRSFRCAGMWLIPFKNIQFPESAHLDIVNKSIGVYNLVPSTISWLLTKTDRNSNKPYFPLPSQPGNIKFNPKKTISKPKSGRPQSKKLTVNADRKNHVLPSHISDALKEVDQNHNRNHLRLRSHEGTTRNFPKSIVHQSRKKAPVSKKFPRIAKKTGKRSKVNVVLFIILSAFLFLLFNRGC